MEIRKLAIIVVAAGFLAACEGDNAGQKQTLGTVLGGVGGAVAGAQFGSGKGRLAATAAGTLLGAVIGSSVGKSLDRADQTAMRNTTQRTLETAPSGESTTWRNPDSGNHGSVTPQPAYQTATGQYCREFQQTVTVGGKTEQAYGTACRQPDGTWKIVNG